MAQRKKLDLSLILPSYNEESYLADSVSRIVRILSYSKLRYEIIFVDDRSDDGTAILIDKILSKHSKWKAIYHRKNMGRGRSMSDGIGLAKGKVVGYIDLDLEVSPVSIPLAVNMILEDEAEVVIGRRISKFSLSILFWEFTTYAVRFWSGKMLGTGKLDTQCGFKFFNRKKILPVASQCHHPRWFWDTEIVVFSRLANLRIHDLPVVYTKRFDIEPKYRQWSDTIDFFDSLWKLWHRLLNRQG